MKAHGTLGQPAVMKPCAKCRRFIVVRYEDQSRPAYHPECLPDARSGEASE